MSETSRKRIVPRVLAEGKVITRSWYDDGTVDSGPRGGSYPAVKWGKVELCLDLRGEHFCLIYPSDGYGFEWWPIEPELLALWGQKINPNHTMEVYRG